MNSSNKYFSNEDSFNQDSLYSIKPTEYQYFATQEKEVEIEED